MKYFVTVTRSDVYVVDASTRIGAEQSCAAGRARRDAARILDGCRSVSSAGMAGGYDRWRSHTHCRGFPQWPITGYAVRSSSRVARAVDTRLRRRGF